ncbi:MAG TPA: M17 family peptidase N-terminal domain-containing protein, partial [Naasia sp.]
MSVPSLALSATPPAEATADVLVLGVRQGNEEAPELLRVDGVDLELDLAAIGVTGGKDQLVRLPSPSGVAAASIALIGLGGAEPSPDGLRYAAGSVTRQLRGAASLAFALPTATADDALAILEGAALGAYSYDDYRVDSKKGAKPPASSVTVLTSVTDADGLVARAEASATAVSTVRDLVNTPPSDLYPASLAARARELADGIDVEFTEWDEEALERDGFGGILGVGVGSTRPPRLVKVAYSPAGATAHVAFVGKGITFDSGGLSLKPAASMVGMKYDMTGAATTLAVTLAAAKLGLPVRITAWLCIAENMPSGSAARPNDVLRIRGGKTVEVLNTDAEGRLVMADGIVAASEEQPDVIVDVATLTG